jgi:hypothetical protein
MSPASYLTAPPRVAAGIVARMDWAVYGALIAGILVFLAAAAFLAVRALHGWRTLKRARRHLAKSLEALAETADHTGEIVERISDQRELEGSLARLQIALRQLDVLREAVDEVTDSVGRVTAVYPRK